MRPINYIQSQREGDLISLPPHHLIELKCRDNCNTSPISKLKKEFQKLKNVNELRNYENQDKVSFFETEAFSNLILYYTSLARAFHDEIKVLGHQQICYQNFLQIIKELGFECRYIDLKN